MPWTDAFAPAEAIYRHTVIRATFGHLAPKPEHTYEGYILFTLGAYGDITVIRDDFGDLPSSPWYFDDLNDFVGRKIEGKAEGTVWRFEGIYRKGKDKIRGVMGETGKGRFVGRVTEVKIPDRAPPKRRRTKRGK